MGNVFKLGVGLNEVGCVEKMYVFQQKTGHISKTVSLGYC